MDEHLRILRLAAERQLPNSVDEASGLDIAVFEELVDARYLKAIDVTSHDGPGYLEPKITALGREYLRELEARAPRGGSETAVPPGKQASIKVFISHSASDLAIVTPLVHLLRSAFNLSAQAIRCTSLDGYRLPGGADTDLQLKSEVHEAVAFIGLLSAASLRSLYVAFELGARWGANRHLIPLLAPGLTPAVLERPLDRLNALRCDSEEQLHQLVDDLGRALGIAPESPSAYRQHILAIQSAQTSSASAHTHAPSSGDRPDELSEQEIQILRLVADHDDYSLDADALTRAMKLNATRVQYHLDRLVPEFLHDAQSYMDPTTYGLTKSGRAILVERGLV
jgi:TIR domain